MRQLLRRTARRTLRRIGRPGLLGLSLLLPVLLIVLFLPRLADEARALQSTIAEQTDALNRPTTPLRRTALAQLTAVNTAQAFPPLSQSAGDLSSLFAVAERHRLALPKGEYQLKTEPNAPLMTYSLSLPVHGNYGQLKSFTADVLEALPHVSLDDLHLARPDASGVDLDAMIRFTLVYRGQ